MLYCYPVSEFVEVLYSKLSDVCQFLKLEMQQFTHSTSLSLKQH